MAGCSSISRVSTGSAIMAAPRSTRAGLPSIAGRRNSTRSARAISGFYAAGGSAPLVETEIGLGFDPGSFAEQVQKWTKIFA